MAEKEIDEATGVETTGHSWDGIKELNNPLPRWWLYLFYICIAVSVVYWVFMPSWPGITGYLKGTRHHSERENVNEAVAALEAKRSDQMQQLLNVGSVGEIENNPDLLQYAITAGASVFGDNCATCHGAGGQGNPGYPSLVDDDWLWGGSLSDIQQTIRYGIRSGHDQARLNTMQAYGRDGVFTRDQIADLAEYVVSLSGREADPRPSSAPRRLSLKFAPPAMAPTARAFRRRARRTSPTASGSMAATASPFRKPSPMAAAASCRPGPTA